MVLTQLNESVQEAGASANGVSEMETTKAPVLESTPASAKSKPRRIENNWEVIGNKHLEELGRTLKQISRNEHPIVAGPWCSEVGFEILYWIPFLRWAKERLNIDPERVTIVSRGGTRVWYDGIAGNYDDIFDYIAPKGFKERNDERIREGGGGQKQSQINEFETELIEMVAKMHNFKRYNIIHPSMMYGLYDYYWKRRLPMYWVERHALHRLMSYRKETPVVLPSNDYIAVKFYFNNAFPATRENIDFVRRTTQRMARHKDVILLNTGLTVDEHQEAAVELGENVYTIEGLSQPEANLDAQTYIVQHASSFVGTYGGFSYLAPLLGVSSLAFYSDATRFKRHHQDFAQRAFDRLDAGRLVVVDVRDAELLTLIGA